MYWISQLRQYLVMLVFALWLGGFTFYSVVVVHAGHKVLHSKVRQGFITQIVTNKLNTLGAVTLGLLLWQMLALRQRVASKVFRLTAWISWSVYGAGLAAQVWLHPHMDALLDPATRSVTDDVVFYGWHRWYLIFATVQWVAALVHLSLLIEWPKRRTAL
jgi:hypothetical protein